MVGDATPPASLLAVDVVLALLDVDDVAVDVAAAVNVDQAATRLVESYGVVPAVIAVAGVALGLGSRAHGDDDQLREALRGAAVVLQLAEVTDA